MFIAIGSEVAVVTVSCWIAVSSDELSHCSVSRFTSGSCISVLCSVVVFTTSGEVVVGAVPKAGISPASASSWKSSDTHSLVLLGLVGVATHASYDVCSVGVLLSIHDTCCATLVSITSSVVVTVVFDATDSALRSGKSSDTVEVVSFISSGVLSPFSDASSVISFATSFATSCFTSSVTSVNGTTASGVSGKTTASCIVVSRGHASSCS